MSTMLLDLSRTCFHSNLSKNNLALRCASRNTIKNRLIPVPIFLLFRGERSLLFGCIRSLDHHRHSCSRLCFRNRCLILLTVRVRS